MAAEIVEEGIRFGKCKYLIQLTTEQAHIFCGNSMPDGCHGGGYIVQHMAFRLLCRTEIGHHLAGFHDNLTKKQRSRTDDFRDHPENTNQSVNLWEVPATGSNGFPNTGNSIQTDDINIMVAKVEDAFDHVIQDNRIVA